MIFSSVFIIISSLLYLFDIISLKALYAFFKASKDELTRKHLLFIIFSYSHIDSHFKILSIFINGNSIGQFSSWGKHVFVFVLSSKKNL